MDGVGDPIPRRATREDKTRQGDTNIPAQSLQMLRNFFRTPQLGEEYTRMAVSARPNLPVVDSGAGLSLE